MHVPVLILLGLATMSSSALAEAVYKWTDDKGRVHYSDAAPPPGQAAKLVDIEVRELSEDERKAAQARLERARSARASPVAVVEPASGATAPGAAGVAPPVPVQTPPGDQTACKAEWKAYLDSVDCFAPFVNTNGSVRPEAYQVCTQVPQPREPCKP